MFVPMEKEIVAVHEAGHPLVAEARVRDPRVQQQRRKGRQHPMGGCRGRIGAGVRMGDVHIWEFIPDWVSPVFFLVDP